MSATHRRRSFALVRNLTVPLSVPLFFCDGFLEMGISRLQVVLSGDGFRIADPAAYHMSREVLHQFRFPGRTQAQSGGMTTRLHPAGSSV